MDKFIFIFKMIEINCVKLYVYIFYIILLDFKKKKILFFILLLFVFFGG